MADERSPIGIIEMNPFLLERVKQIITNHYVATGKQLRVLENKEKLHAILSVKYSPDGLSCRGFIWNRLVNISVLDPGESSRIVSN